jgi:hypothetical protein
MLFGIVVLFLRFFYGGIAIVHGVLGTTPICSNFYYTFVVISFALRCWQRFQLPLRFSSWLQSNACRTACRTAKHHYTLGDACCS